MTQGQAMPPSSDLNLMAHPEVLVLLWPDAFGVNVLTASSGVAGMGRQLLQDDLIQVPGRPGRVHGKSVAAHIFALVLLSMNELELIALRPETKKVLFIKKTQVVAVRGSSGGVTQGLSAASLGHFKPGESSLTVRDLIRRWFRDRVPVPFLDVIMDTERTAERLGLYRKVTGTNAATRAAKRVAHVVAGGSFTYEPVEDLMAQTQEVASHLADHWRQFGPDDPELREHLLKDVEGAIESMELPEPPESSD